MHNLINNDYFLIIILILLFKSNRNETYASNSRLPQLNQRQIYELVNNMTNRKPVKINESNFLFDHTTSPGRARPNLEYIPKNSKSQVVNQSQQETPGEIVKNKKTMVQINEVKT